MRHEKKRCLSASGLISTSKSIRTTQIGAKLLVYTSSLGRILKDGSHYTLERQSLSIQGFPLIGRRQRSMVQYMFM